MALLLKASQVVPGNANEVVLEEGQLIIGRLPSNHLVIPGADVEPIHAMIEMDDKGVATLIDMGSDGGVKLNSKVIEVVESIKVGDVITIGSVRIVVLDASAAISAEPKNGSFKDDHKTAVSSETKASFKTSSNQKETVAASLDNRKTVKAVYDEESSDTKFKNIPKIKYGALFQPGKERGQGSTLEVVAFWDESILDVRHYGGSVKPGEIPRPNEVILGNEEDDHIIGVGPKANTRNLKLADVDIGKANIVLNSEMRAKVRRGAKYEKLEGPAKFKLSAGEMALIKHGPVNYFLTNVSLPNPLYKKFEDIDGKPLIIIYAIFLWLLGSIGIYSQARLGAVEKEVDSEAWGQILALRTPTPKPVNTPKEKIPAPKPTVVVQTPKPIEPPKVTKPIEKPKPVATPVPQPKVEQNNVKSLSTAKVPVPATPNKEKPGPIKGEKPAKDTALGPKNPNKAAGNSGGAAGGTKSGQFASQRQGKDESSAMGADDVKNKDIGGINFDEISKGLGKTMDISGAGAIATELKSSGGGTGGGRGSAARGNHGFGGMGQGSASLGTRGVGSALNGLGGGAGGLGRGGDGGSGGGGAPGGGRKIAASAVVVPEGDPAVEGNLTKEEIEAVIRANLAQIKACYERSLQGKRDLAGKVKTAFTIGTDGRVSQSSIASSDLGDSPAENCIVGAIRRWKFPLPRGGGVVSVTYPFVFNPQR
jgi:TonB family protein